MFAIRKLFKFEMAHLLSSCYSDECKNIHGHSYKMEVIIKAASVNKDGMVIDFKKLKEIIKKKIIDNYDHALVWDNSSPAKSALLLLCKTFNIKYMVFELNPTAENMAQVFYKDIFRNLSKEIPTLISLKVKLHETDTGYAEYTKGG